MQKRSVPGLSIGCIVIQPSWLGIMAGDDVVAWGLVGEDPPKSHADKKTSSRGLSCSGSGHARGVYMNWRL